MGKITDILTGADAEQAAEEAIGRHNAKQEISNELDTTGLALLKEQAELEEQVGRTADDAKALKLQTRIDEIVKLRAVNKARKKIAAEELAKAEDDLRRARAGNRVKVVRKHAKKRSGGAEKIAQGIALFHEGWKEFFESTEAINLFAGSDLLAGAHGGYGGMFLRTPEIISLAERELARVSGVGPLEISLVPPLPGSYIGATHPRKNPKLTDEIEKANNYLISCAEKMPAPSEAKPKVVAPAPVAERDPDGLDEVPAQPSGAHISAEQIMASKGRVKMS